jgi:hypothetical protein
MMSDDMSAEAAASRPRGPLSESIKSVLVISRRKPIVTHAKSPSVHGGGCS